MITVNGRDRIEWTEGMSVQDVLDAMGWAFPLIVATVNDERIKPTDFAIHLVPDEADVRLIHIMHGG
jgi:thiamine biosynthesis protein ThiS